MLKIDDFQLLMAESLKSATKCLHAESSINLIICAVPMENEEGFEFITYVRNNLRFDHIHILVTLEKFDENTIMKCRSFGIKNCLIKPFSAELLIQRIYKILDSCSGTVLIAADDPIVMQNLAKTLERENYKIVTASSTLEVMNMLRSSQNNKGGFIDLVIADINLPPTNGLDLLVQVKEFSPSLPVALITSSGSTFNRENVIQAGADSSIEKPFYNIQISRTIKSLLAQVKNKRPNTISK